METFFTGPTDDLSAIGRDAVADGGSQTEVLRMMAEGGGRGEGDRNRNSLLSSGNDT